MSGFRVQRKRCRTCIYRKDSVLDIEKLENDVRDRYMGFKGHRVCHHSKDVCCRGFWDHHKDEFAAGQIAQRLNAVEFVDVDIFKEPPCRGRPSSKPPARTSPGGRSRSPSKATESGSGSPSSRPPWSSS